MAYRSKVALVYLLGFALDLLNMFSASIAYPDIARELQASVSELAWISNAYMLGLTLIIPLSVWLAAKVGERRLILGSLALFGLASSLVAGANSIEALIGWRLLQGLGGGLLIPVGQAMAFRHCPVPLRSRLTAWVLSVALLVPALSPAAGGWIVETLSWRWVFLLNLPLTLLTLLLAALWLQADGVPDGKQQRGPLLDLSELVLGRYVHHMAPLRADFSHVTQLSLLGKSTQNVPDAFLNCFPGLTGLEMRDFTLGRLPHAMSRMP